MSTQDPYGFVQLTDTTKPANPPKPRREVIREREIPGMGARELRATQAILLRLLRLIDRRLSALAASDTPEPDPSLAARVEQAKASLRPVPHADVRYRADVVRAELSTGRRNPNVERRADEVRRELRGG